LDFFRDSAIDGGLRYDIYKITVWKIGSGEHTLLNWEASSGEWTRRRLGSPWIRPWYPGSRRCQPPGQHVKSLVRLGSANVLGKTNRPDSNKLPACFFGQQHPESLITIYVSRRGRR
jgi:hypothetical protein